MEDPKAGHPQPTPCIHVCVMDEKRGVCEGCHRTLEEICHWPGGLGGSVFAVTMRGQERDS